MNISNSVLYLRKLTLKYVSKFKTLFNDPDMCRYLAIPYPLSDTWIREYIKESMVRFDSGEKYTWGIFRHSLDDLIGVAVLRDIDIKNKTAKIGYSTGRKYWNNGFTSMTVRMIVEYAFKELDINRIEVRIDTDDVKSKKLLGEIYAVEEGILRQAVSWNDTFKDVILYSILRTEYFDKIQGKTGGDV